MLCPHCGHDNVEGRKFCRVCAKPLTADASAAKPAPPVAAHPLAAVPAPPSGPTNKMAVASLVLSFLALVVPFAIASIVMGHISRRQIAHSNGRQTGTWFAFAGLVLSYLQLTVAAVFALAFVGLTIQMGKRLDHDPYVRAALVERILEGDPRHPSAAVVAEHRKNLLDALRLIRAREYSYKDSRPGGYSCNLFELTNEDPEIKLHVTQSRYQIQIICREFDSQNAVPHAYVATAVAFSNGNPPDSPSFCLDSNGTIRKYSTGYTSAAMTNRTFIGREPCPDDGEPVE
ncbi:MAG TPA: DUF4190 domain-containing protein [Candidatus Acidoferrales bacterium]|nr:DUF4190 domain-containing protein [Candidatus Acidoferrales bacterium]